MALTSRFTITVSAICGSLTCPLSYNQLAGCAISKRIEQIVLPLVFQIISYHIGSLPKYLAYRYQGDYWHPRPLDLSVPQLGLLQVRSLHKSAPIGLDPSSVTPPVGLQLGLERSGTTA